MEEDKYVPLVDVKSFLNRDQGVDPQDVEPAPESEEPYVPLIDVKSFLDEQKAIDETSLDTLATGNGKEAAEINKIAKELGEAPEVVAENLIDKRIEFSKRQLAKVVQPADNLRGWVANNPEVAPSLQQALPPLAKFEAEYKKHQEKLTANFSHADELYGDYEDYRLDPIISEIPENNWHARREKASYAGNYVGHLQTQRAKGWHDVLSGKKEATKEFLKWDEEADREVQAISSAYGELAAFDAAEVVGQMEVTPYYFGDKMGWGAAEGAAIGAAAAIPMAAAGIASAATMAPVLMGASIGLRYQQTRVLEAGLAYKELLDSGLDDERARVGAHIVGAINGSIEVLGDAVLGGMAKSAIGTAVKAGVVHNLNEHVKAQTMRGALTKTALTYFGGVGTEVVGEVAQEATNIAVGEWGKKYTGAEAITVGELVSQLSEIAIKTFNASLALGLIGAGPILVHQIHRVQEAEGRKKIFSDLAADMKGNEAIQTAPEVVGAAVQHVADKSQASNIYIDGYAFMQTMQASNISIEDLRQVAPEVAGQIENAARTGGDVVIPTGDYAVKIAPTDMGEALSMHVRTEEGQLSAAEAVQVDRVVKGMVRDAVNDPEALQQQVNEKLDEEYKEEAKKLEEHYRAEFEKYPKFKKAEARMQAKYGATVATLMAKRAGISPSELQNFAPTLVMVDAEQNQAGMESRAIGSDGTFNQSMLTDVMRTAVSKVARIVDRVLNGQSTNGKGLESFEDYLPVSDRLVSDLKEQGVDVEGYLHCVVDGDLQHAQRRHGEGLEKNKKQSGLTREDYLRLPLVVTEYDSIQLGGVVKSSQLQAVLYTKTFPDGVQYVVEEVRKGRKKLAFRTAYKKVTPTPNVPSDDASPSALRPRRSGVNSLSENILPVNGSTDQDSYAQSGIGEISKSKASIDTVRAKYQGTDQWLKAPNGEDTQLTETQWCLVRTPEFKAWFGDWENDPANASKVVDKNGEPLVVYHGGQGRVEDFSRGSKRGHMGLAYFTDSVAAGSSYAFLGGIDGTVETPDDAGYQWTRRSDKNIQAHPHITKAFLNVRNPITPDEIRLKDVVNMFGKEIADLEEDNVAFARFDGDFDAAAEWLSDPSNLQEWLEETLTDDVASNAIENDLLSLVAPDGELQASQGFIELHLLGEIPQYMEYKGNDGFAYFDNEAGGTTYVVQSPTQVKSASFNNGRFNPNDSNILRQDVATPADPLVTIHNIRETGLLNVNKLGALPVPSLAVTKVGNEYSQYGEISLIGTKGMVDPSQTPVFSADAYTARFPKLNWTNSVDRPKAEALAKEVKEAQMRVGDSGTGPFYYLIYSPDRDQAINALSNDVAGMVMFLNEKGIKFRLVRAKPELSFLIKPETKSYVESEQLTSENLEEGSSAHKRISDLAIERIKQVVGTDTTAKGAAAFKRRIHKTALESYEQTGFIPLKQAKSIVDDVNQYNKEMETYKKGKAPIDDWATKQALQKKIEPMRAEYQKYIADKVGGVFKTPRIQHGERTLAFNLANIVKVMTSNKSIRGAEEGALGGYGYGAIRAGATTQYGSMEELQADRNRVVDRDTSYASEKEVDDKLEAFMNAAGRYFKGGVGSNSFGAFEAAGELLFKAAEKGGTSAAIRAAARSDFKALPPELVKQGVEALDAAKNVLTDYMEAKPQRAVQLSEFAGAVVPETIGAEARAVLENAGLKIQTYDPNEKGARQKATEELSNSLQAERGDILYQLMGEQGAGRLSPAESQARLGALKVAKQMRLAGKTPKEIRLATGWERGVDGLWRYEFTDAQWANGFFEDRYPDETTYMLTDLVDAPELFEAYPELKTYRISFGMEESDTLGSHHADEKRIWINSNQFTGDPAADADSIRSTLLHEVQHAIQKQEGFVGGGNPRDSMMAYQNLLKEEVKPLYELMRSPEWILYQNILRTGTIEEIAAAEKDPVVQNTLALQQKIRKKFSIGKNDKVLESVIDKPHSDNSVVWNWDSDSYGFKIYKRLGGEVESRNVQARMNMTEDERRQRLLEETADIAPEEQVLLGSSELRPQGPRGTYAPGTNTISITLNGDLSTFAHEMGHWYLEQIFTLSKRADVDPTIVEDAETIKKELGIPDAWDNLTFDAKRKYHEKFAYLTEIYLATGKAPTKSTESFFARMGAWIADVYRQFTGGIKQQRSEQYAKEFNEQLPEISPELKRVFDRMVASQDMLKQAEAAESLRPLFDTKPEDMDEATWIEMQSQRMVAEAEGAAKINELHAKDEKWYTGARSKLLRKLQREAKEIRNKIRERIETQLRNQDVYIALEIFKTGGKALGLDNLKMDPDALKDAGYTVTEIAKLRNLGCVRKGGLTPTQARELLRPFARFKTDKRMIRALINAKPINEAIEEATTEECLRKHSEMFDSVKLDAAVTAALHTEARERMVANELKYLAGMKGMNSRVLNEAARRAAQELVSGTKVGQVTVKKYIALEAKASRKAYEALAKGDRKAAAVAKHQQLLYAKCVREAMDLEKDVAKLKGFKTKIFQSDKKIGKTRDTGILGVARYILTNHGLGKIRAADMDPSAAMRYVDKLQKYQYEQFIAFKGLMERHGYKPNDPGLNAMTVQELRALIGDVEYCWKASRDAKVVKLGDAAKTREEVVTELLQQGQSLGLKEYAPGRGEKVTASERAAHGLLSIAAQLRRVESWCNGMDAGNPDKPFRRYIYDPVAQACAKYRVANAAIQEKLANLVAARRKAWDKMTDIEAPEIKYVFRTKAELIGAILHTGNQSNKQKLLLGGRGDDKPWARLIEGPDGAVHVDTSAWDAFVQRCYAEGIITKEDMDFVQAVWDLMESEKPLIQRAFYQIYGFYFDEIPATEVQTPWGNYRGGYVPAMTDRYIVAEKGVQEEIERITENEYLTMMPVSRPGFAISRVAGYNKPLSLDIGQLCGHVEKTMRFAHIAPVVQEVAKVINDRDFTDFVNKINPHLLSDLLAPWLKRAYSQRIDDGKSQWWVQLTNKYRSLAAINMMACNIINASQQVTGFSIALTKVKPKYLTIALGRLTCEGGSLVERVTTLSPFMQARLKDRSFEYESRVQRVASATGKLFSQKGLFNKAATAWKKADPLRNWISSHAYFLQTAMQIPIDVTVWVAAFDEAVAKGMSDREAALEADSVVRTTQSSFAAEDVAPVETGGALWRAFLVFYNYFGMQYNLLEERRAESNLKPLFKKYGTQSLDFLLIIAIPAILSKVIELAWKGELGGDDEDEWEAIDWLQLIVGEPIKNRLTTIPVVGSFANSAGAIAAKEGSVLAQAVFGKDPYMGKPMTSPALDLSHEAFLGLRDLHKIAEGEEVSRRRIARDLASLLTITTQLPFGTLKKPLGYVGNVMDGNESTDNPIYGVLRGK